MNINNTIFHEAYVSANWEPFLSQLPEWEQIRRNVFSDGVSFFVQKSTQHSIALRIANKKALEIIAQNNDTEVINDKVVFDTFDFPFEISFNSSKKKKRSPIAFNHFAVTSRNISKAKKWWGKITQCQEILEVKKVFDPLVNGPLDTIHFYKPEELYLTVRGQGDKENAFHHLGFEAKSMSYVQIARNILVAIGWDIFWEGVIDESYVLHFEGPDGLIHDVFCTQNVLREKA